MAKSQRQMKDIVFKHAVPVKIKRLKIERASSLKFLDVDKLSRAAKAEFDVGHVKVGRRRSTVRAVVRKGMVVALRTELCAECEPARMTPEVLDLLKTVRRRIGTGGRPTRPMPVAAFLKQKQIETSHCYLICIFWFCFVCCGFDSDPHNWLCSVLGGSYLSQ